MKEPVALDPFFHEILHRLESQSHHFFITGKAGTGKSTLLQLFRRTTRKKVVILAPTGIAALHVQGQTIHSFFRFPPKLLIPDELVFIKSLSRILKAIETMVIDEISMVRADILDAIDFTLRRHRNSDQAFGGVQLIFFGDLFQLPPVVSTREEKLYFSQVYPNPYFFGASVFSQQVELECIELTKVYRQQDKRFIRLLDAIRTLSFDHDELEEINARYLPDAEIEEPYITLCSTNAAARQINAERLAAIDQPSVYYRGKVNGEFNASIYPAEFQLELKVGAQVMLLRNDPEKRYVNGSLATVHSVSEEKVSVIVSNHADSGQEPIELAPVTWENIRYSFSSDESPSVKSDVIGSFTQLPLSLAWAVTIHKSQGKTFDRVAIDLGRGAFEHGQTYVALSRCRTLEGIFLRKPLKPQDIMVDETVVEYYASRR